MGGASKFRCWDIDDAMKMQKFKPFVVLSELMTGIWQNHFIGKSIVNYCRIGIPCVRAHKPIKWVVECLIPSN